MEPIKYVYINFKDCTYLVRAEVIADHRARYNDSAYIENEEERKTAYEQELASTLSSSEKLIDWAHNYMSWAHLEPTAVLVSTETPQRSLYTQWNRSEMTITLENPRTDQRVSVESQNALVAENLSLKAEVADLKARVEGQNVWSRMQRSPSE